MKCKCLKRTCGYKWDSKGEKKPKACPSCKSYTWDKKKRTPAVAPGVTSAIEMICSKCSKKLEEGVSVYRAQEGKNIGGSFVFDDLKLQGLYCGDCMVPEDVLPFAKDKC